MKALVIAAVAVSLSGCASLGSVNRSDQTETLKALMQNLQHCERHYQGGIGAAALGSSITVTINCEPAPWSVPAPDPIAPDPTLVP